MFHSLQIMVLFHCKNCNRKQKKREKFTVNISFVLNSLKSMSFEKFYEVIILISTDNIIIVKPDLKCKKHEFEDNKAVCHPRL